MRRAMTSTLLLMLLILSAVAGCLGEPTSSDPQDADTGDDPDAGAGAPGGGGSGGAEPTSRPEARLVANATAGTAPFAVTFDLEDAAASNATVTWTLDLGDGNATQGSNLPATWDHVYTFSGQFLVNLTVAMDDGFTSNATVGIEVEAAAPSGPPAAPPPTQYHSGPVAGCLILFGDEYDWCPAYHLGPGNEDGWGLWIELEPGHLGMTFTTTSLSGDSDGWVFADPTGAPLRDVHNGGDEATGTIQEGDQWLLIISFAAPSDDMVVVFTA